MRSSRSDRGNTAGTLGPHGGPRAGRGFQWIVLAILLQSTAAACAKLAGLESRGGGLFELVWNPWYAAQILALALQAGCWIMALRAFPLSFAYPFMSLVLPLNLLAARFLFAEQVRTLHAAGIALLVCGIWIVARQTPAEARS